MKISELLETATAGATSAANVGTVVPDDPLAVFVKYTFADIAALVLLLRV